MSWSGRAVFFPSTTEDCIVFVNTKSILAHSVLCGFACDFIGGHLSLIVSGGISIHATEAQPCECEQVARTLGDLACCSRRGEVIAQTTRRAAAGVTARWPSEARRAESIIVSHENERVESNPGLLAAGAGLTPCAV